MVKENYKDGKPVREYERLGSNVARYKNLKFNTWIFNILEKKKLRINLFHTISLVVDLSDKMMN